MAVDSLSGADPTAEKSTEDAANVNWLASLARDCQKLVHLTHHIRKRGLFDIDGEITLDRVRGASAILQYSRLVWAIDTPNPQDKNTKRLHVIKSNIGIIPESVGFTLDDKGVTFGKAPEKPKIETLLDRGIDLIHALIGREPIPSIDIDAEFKGAGLSERTLREVKSTLSIVSFKKGKTWYCSLPAKEEIDD